MSRPLSNTVDYFPHSCHHGKTLAILQERFGNDGYAFWFRLLELLGKTHDHVYTCNLPVETQFLSVETHVTPEKCLTILDMLALLDAIDAPLWSTQRVIWCENFAKGVASAYKNRKRVLPQKPVSTSKTIVSTSKTPVSTPDNPHMKGNEMKEESPISSLNQNPEIKIPDQKIIEPIKIKKTRSAESRSERSTNAPEGFTFDDSMMSWALAEGFTGDLKKETQKFLNHHKAKGKKFVDWKAAWRNWILNAIKYAKEKSGIIPDQEEDSGEREVRYYDLNKEENKRLAEEEDRIEAENNRKRKEGILKAS